MVLPENIDEIICDPRTYGDEEAYHQAFAALRENDPVHWAEPRDYRPFWAVTRHEDIQRVEMDAANFANEPRQFLVTKADEEMLLKTTGSRNFAYNLVAMDNPDHRQYRGLTASWFGPKQVRALEEEIRHLARETVDKLIETGSPCDFAKDIAAWYPLRTIMLVLGVPREDEPMMLALSQKVFGSTDVDTGGGDGMTSMMEAKTEFCAYFDKLTADRRQNPRNDVATLLATAMINDEPMQEGPRNDYYLIVAAAGHDTTSSAISGGLLALLRNPGELQKLRENRDLLPNAIEEFIRWTTPVKHFFRTALADCEVGGKAIAKGDALMMCYPSANRDTAVFEDPFAFRIDRPEAKKHLAFGYGPHTCLGNNLAKLEIRLLFEEVLDRIDTIELAGDPAWIEANFVSGLKRLPIAFSAR
ncbi:MAG: cytochrome P450 [Novosphingobium sp.]